MVFLLQALPDDITLRGRGSVLYSVFKNMHKFLKFYVQTEFHLDNSQSTSYFICQPACELDLVMLTTCSVVDTSPIAH